MSSSLQSKNKKKAAASKKALPGSSKKRVSGFGGDDDDDFDDDDDDDDDGIGDEEILDEASALAAATLAAGGRGGDDDDDEGGAKSDLLLSAAGAVSVVEVDDEEEDDDDLEGLLDAAVTLPGPPSSSASSSRPSPAVGGGGSVGKRRSSAAAAAAAAAASADPLSSIVGIPEDEGDEGGGAEEDEPQEELPAIDYLEPPRRERALGELLAAAGVGVDASLLATSSSSFSYSSLDEIAVTGVEDDVSLLSPGDLFATQVTAAKTSTAALARELSRAAAAGAVAALVPESYAGPLGALFGSSSPSSPLPLPVVFVVTSSSAAAAAAAASSSPSDDAAASTSTSTSASTSASSAGSAGRAAGAVAREFYDDPTSRMSTVLFVGGPGKTTSAWLTRGVLEEAGALVGMVGSIEYALHADRLDARGGIWAAAEEDPTEARECSRPFHLAPYRGKYPLPSPDSTPLRVQKVTAGMVDRGATAAIIELSVKALVAGAAEGVDADVAVFTGSPEKSAAATEARKKRAAAAAASAAASAVSSSPRDPPSSFNSPFDASAAAGASAASDAALAAAEALIVAEGDAELAALAAVFESMTDIDRQRAVINKDDPNAELIRVAAERGGAPQISFGFYNTSADVKMQRVEFGLWETEMLVGTPIGALSLSTQLVCRHNAFNVLASVAAGLAVTVPSGTASGSHSPAAAAAAALSPPGEEEEGEEEEGGGAGEGEETEAGREENGAAGGDGLGDEIGGFGPTSGYGRALDLRTIVRGIEATEVIPGRTEAVDEGQPFAVLVDSARTPDALGRLLDGVREAGAKRLILVIGCEGGRPRAARPYMGEVAHFKADIVIVTSDNPRGEDPRAIVSDVVSGFPDELLRHNARVPYPPGFLQDPGRVSEAEVEYLWDACYQHARYVCEDRWMAIRWAVGTATADDAVLIVGKGAEDFQEWVKPGRDGGTVRGWFDDRVEARHALVQATELWSVTSLDRSELPWMEWDEREARL